uniref:Uncharacterized protein n=1 Tax=Nelumbo nucifera TaxID=4432 RepID=A0A822Z452_NELNU|nr:TPA_asm: hypothetical protein HUJ06_014155 [Nelumbo nucifera]
MIVCNKDVQSEVAIEEHFKLIDKQAEVIMNMQLEGEETKMREMMMKAEKMVKACSVDPKQHK